MNHDTSMNTPIENPASGSSVAFLVRLSGWLLPAVAVSLFGLSQTSCSFDSYCLNCEADDAGGSGIDSNGGDGDGGGGPNDGGAPADACIQSGIEQCDGLDNDCNGMIDDGVLPGTGDECSVDVGECSSGITECSAGEIVCAGGVEPVPEICDGLDNDCNGVDDNGDPGGGNSCGTDVGECVAGTTVCSGGAIDCIGDVGMEIETCDGRDNDCDSMFDEGTGGGDCGPVNENGLCEFGTNTCIGGQLQCQGATFPQTEVCDNMDHDCDGNMLNGYDLQNDVLNCGTCGHSCYGDPLPMGENTAIRQCVAGSCDIGLCETAYFDLNDDYGDGCEYGPCEFQGSQEACNGTDDDCDSVIDEGVGTAPAVCLMLGECAGTVATCEGTDGWECTYGSTVSTDGMGNVIPETECDGLDNDCDGAIDEGYDTVGEDCDDGEMGVCRGVGMVVCNGAGDGVECNITDPGMMSMPETCDNTDEDCDGTVDEGDHQMWVDIGGSVEMFAHEASRPDASTVAQGFANHVPCSQPAALPWTNLTHPQAEAACAAIGARLCTETEWESTCEAGGSCEWSYQNNCTTYQAQVCNGNDFDTDSGTPGDQDAAIPTGSSAMCHADLASGDVFDMSGNIKEWTAERSAGINPIRGGSYTNTQVGISCQLDFLVADDNFFFPNIGFRCCR